MLRMKAVRIGQVCFGRCLKRVMKKVRLRIRPIVPSWAKWSMNVFSAIRALSSLFCFRFLILAAGPIFPRFPVIGFFIPIFNASIGRVMCWVVPKR